MLGAKGASIRSPPSRLASPRQRIGPELEPVHLARVPLSPFHMERRAGADRRPETAPLPAGCRVVNAAVEPLGIESQRIGDTEDDPLSVLEDEEPLGLVACVDRDVLAKAEGVELVYPGVVAAFATPRAGDVPELRKGLGVEGPPLRTVLARGAGPVERALALASVEARNVATP